MGPTEVGPYKRSEAARRSLSLHRDLQFLQPRSNVRSGGLGLHLAIDIEDLPVRPDVEGPTAGEAHRRQNAVRRGDLLVRVAQDRIVGVERLGELRVGLEIVDADREIRGVELPQRRAALTERLALGRSTTGEGFWKPRQYYPMALELRQCVRLAIAAGEGELRSLIADL